MEGEDVKKRHKYDRVEVKVCLLCLFKFQSKGEDEKSVVNSGYVVENILIGYGRSLAGNVGNIRFMRRKGLKMNDKEDEDKDEIKGLIWVNNHIANKRRKYWASVIIGLFRKEMLRVCVE
ncbi:hypothetical protein Tco_1453006 [Tanacetum coccineum]